MGKVTHGANEPLEVTAESAHETGLPDHSRDIVAFRHCWNRISDHEAALREAARVLREGGRLIIEEHENRAAMRKLVHFLEHHGWTVQHSEHLSRDEYRLELTVSDESVQS
jgi:ubiquinone/menaquinone biosynthesis C-methylase UbiE